MFQQPLFLSRPPRKLALLWQVLWLGGLAAACSPEPELLNSERIALRYGNYAVRVLQSDERQRVSSLYSTGTDGEVCRTFAIVDFLLPIDTSLATEHRAVLAGGSIGEVFRDAGWQTEKFTLSIREAPALDQSAQLLELMQLGPAVSLAMHRYRFEVTRDELRIPYAVITEIHHPDYLTVQQLQQIYD